MLTAVLSTVVVPQDGVYDIRTLTEKEKSAIDLQGIPHYVGHPDTKKIVEDLGAIQANSTLFSGLKTGEVALCTPIKQGKSNRGTVGHSVAHQSIQIEDLDFRILTRIS